MAIEPLSSAMTYQVQPTIKAQPVTPVNTDVPADGQTVNVDEKTASVTQTQAEDNSSESEGNGSFQQQQQLVMQAMGTQAASEQLKKAIAEMNRKINNSHEEAVFGIHEETNRVMIKILDKETKEVLKEFPPEKTLDMIAKIWEMAGILVDEKR